MERRAAEWITMLLMTEKGPQGGMLAAAIERWTDAAARLGLSEVAVAAGALLVAAELDEGARAGLVGAEGNTLAPRRADLLRALGARFEPARAATGLADLERRGVAAPLPSYAGPWLSAEIEIDRRVRLFVLGAAAAPERTQMEHPIPRVDNAICSAALRTSIEGDRLVILVRGRTGSGRDLALARLLGMLARPALKKSVLELRQPHDPLEPELSGAIAVWDARRSDPSPDDYDLARRFLARSAGVAIAVLDRHQDAPDVDARIAITIEADPIDAAERRAGWLVALGEERAEAATTLSLRSRCGAGLALRAARMADGADEGELVAAIERELGALVRPSTLRGILVEHPDVPMTRIVATTDVTQMLEQVVLLARLASSVETPGRIGIKALFSGASGTGKTMAARAIATELRLPLYRVDLAGVVSKWVGETEKNLREALAAAESAGAVLLFDEGDALFGKRGEVSRGSDRYANTEVAYLLQAVEAYDGVAIVTTNLRSNIDKAFERRFDACVEFTAPSPQDRALLWSRELGAAGREVPEPVFTEIARRAELNGGSIAAAARVARVIALSSGRALVTEADLKRAVRTELLKSGSAVQAARW